MIDINRPDFMHNAAVKPGHNIFAELGISLLLMVILSVISLGVETAVTFILLTATNFGNQADIMLVPIVSAAIGILSSVLMIVCAVLYCRVFEKRGADTMGFTKKGAVRQYLIGVLAGLAVFAAAYLICAVFGGVKVSDTSADYILSLLPGCVSMLAAGLANAVFYYGYLMVSISRRYSVVTAVIASALLSSLAQVLNYILSELRKYSPSFDLLLLIIVFLSLFLFDAAGMLLMIRSQNIWTAAAFGTVLKLCQLIFTALFTLNANDVITGGYYGILRGTASAIALAAVTAALLYSIKKKGGLLTDKRG